MKTAIMTEPVGMFKNLSPDYDSYIRAPGPRPASNAVQGGYMDVIKPKNLSKGANAIINVEIKKQHKVGKEENGFAFKGALAAKDLSRSQIILKAKAEKIVRAKEAGKELVKAQQE